jgi:hypothetical protein
MADPIPFQRPAVKLSNAESARPFIDGKPFCELWGLSREMRNLLISRELVFNTVFERNGVVHSGTVISPYWQGAQAIADARGFGERVCGAVMERIEP